MSDAAEARADAKAAKARAKSLRPWYRKKRFWVLGTIAVLVVISIAGAGSKTKTTATTSDVQSTQSSSHAAVDDVTLDGCTSDSTGFVTMPVTIVNHTSKRSNYVIELTVVDSAGVKVGDGLASSNNVDAGQTAKDDGIATVTGSHAGLTCKISSVTRYAA